VFSKTGSCRPVAPSSRPEAEPISGADGSTGKIKHAFDSDNLSFLGTLQRHDAFNKIALLDGGAVRSALEKHFPPQTFAPRNI
jgi:hypothetical protein